MVEAVEKQSVGSADARSINSSPFSDLILIWHSERGDYVIYTNNPKDLKSRLDGHFTEAQMKDMADGEEVEKPHNFNITSVARSDKSEEEGKSWAKNLTKNWTASVENLVVVTKESVDTMMALGAVVVNDRNELRGIVVDGVKCHAEVSSFLKKSGVGEDKYDDRAAAALSLAGADVKNRGDVSKLVKQFANGAPGIDAEHAKGARGGR